MMIFTFGRMFPIILGRIYGEQGIFKEEIPSYRTSNWKMRMKKSDRLHV
jgi:hypothetical protein